MLGAAAVATGADLHHTYASLKNCHEQKPARNSDEHSMSRLKEAIRATVSSYLLRGHIVRVCLATDLLPESLAHDFPT